MLLLVIIPIVNIAFGAIAQANIETPKVFVRDLEIQHPEFALYVMPNEKLPIKVQGVTGDVQLESSSGALNGSTGDWVWQAPGEVGQYQLDLKIADITTNKLTAIVLRPFSAIDDEELDGYEIGEYPDDPLDDLEVYLPPKGFIQLLKETLDIRVSPRFKLGQFRCKQAGGYPAYLVLREQLLLKLELILDKLAGRGIHAETLHVMSGYRTPEYNDDIGNGEYSRHIYGDAADIFVDQNPRDGRMDDLNGDGRTNREDARWLSQLVDEIDNDPAHKTLKGGMGIYTSNDYHGPFVHVDVRGFITRWED